MTNYEQGRVATPLGKLYEIAKALSINIMDLLELTEDKVVPDLIEEYKKIESQELRNALMKSLFKSIQICEEKVKRAEKIKDLVKGGIVRTFLGILWTLRKLKTCCRRKYSVFTVVVIFKKHV